MKIRMITRYAGPAGTWNPGQVADFPRDQAQDLIAGGYAFAVKSGEAAVETAKAPVAEAETAVAPAAQPAEKSGAKKSGAKKSGAKKSGA